MKTKLYNIFPGIVLISLGIALLSHSLNFLTSDSPYLIGLILLTLSPFYLFLSFGQTRKEGLFLSVFLFFTGLILFIPQQFLILNKNALFLPTYLIIPAVIFFLISIDKPKFKKLLVAAALLLIACFAAVLLTEKSLTIKYINNIGLIITSYWRELILFLGIGFILKE